MEFKNNKWTTIAEYTNPELYTVGRTEQRCGARGSYISTDVSEDSLQKVGLFLHCQLSPVFLLQKVFQLFLRRTWQQLSTQSQYVQYYYRTQLESLQSTVDSSLRYKCAPDLFKAEIFIPVPDADTGIVGALYTHLPTECTFSRAIQLFVVMVMNFAHFKITGLFR